MKVTSPLLTELLLAESDIEKTLAGIKVKIRDERLRLIFEHHKIRVGSIVERGGKEYKVVFLDRLYWDTPWAYGAPKKNDGTWSLVDRQLYSDWKVITP